jgi:hypothetical protein
VIPFLYKLSIVFAIGAHGADLGITSNCIGRGVCRELNPALARFDNPAVFGFAKMGVATGGILVTDKLYKTDTKKGKIGAIIMNFAVASAFTAIAVRNTREAGR